MNRIYPIEPLPEVEMLVAWLEFHRATLRDKASGLNHDQLHTSLAPSPLTLGSLIKHMAWVEEYWFSERFFCAGFSRWWDNADFDADNDWEWHSAIHDSDDDLFAMYDDAIEGSRSRLSQALAEGSLDSLSQGVGRTGARVSLRWVLVHMIEEYARHNGHADLIRESIDGSVGV